MILNLQKRLRSTFGKVLLTLALASIVFVTLMLIYVREPHTTSVMRGYVVANRMGCFACHGPEGRGGVMNPNSAEGEIPPFGAGGTLMYYVQNEEEFREWVLYGSPKRLWKDGIRPPEINSNQKNQETRPKIQMPAYEDLLSENDLRDLLDYFKAMADLEHPTDPKAEKGLQLTKNLGCFGCHGTLGREGISNPGSFKGLIPPWDGKDFASVVENDEELKQWILEGKIPRFESNPLARYFTHGQKIQMPAYKNILKEGELEDIISYIKWLRDPQKHPVQYWVEPNSPLSEPLVKRGEWLYKQHGCVACHGVAGEGGVINPNYIVKFVPSLNDLAERMELFDKEQVMAIITAAERGVSLEALQENPPIPKYAAFYAQYKDIAEVIIRGSLAKKKDPDGPNPPMHMPAWNQRMHPDTGPISKSDIDAIILYLLSLEHWD